MAQKGAAKVIGIDIQEQCLETGIKRARQLGVSDRCFFTKNYNELADVVISKDAFEHFSDPAEILQIMASLLKPQGYVLAAFGPTWLHPYGGHLFSEVDGGLNQLTIARFERIVANSPFRFEWLETIPIKGISLLKIKTLREIGSSIVRCKLVLK